MNAIVNHRKLDYLVHGNGSSQRFVLLVPGTGCSATTWAPELVDGLVSLGLGVVAYDPRDTGSSEHVPDDETYTMWDLAADAAGLIELAAGGQPSVVIGHSLGGAVSQILAVLRPDLVSELVLLGAPARPGRGFEAGPEGAATSTTDWDDPEEVMAALIRSTGDDERADALWVRDLFASRPVPMSTRSVRRHTGAAFLTTPPTDEQLASVHVPILVVAGTHDRSIPTGNAVAITRDHPDARLELISGMGHWPSRRHIDALLRVIADHVFATRSSS